MQIALKSDGTVVAVGHMYDGSSCDVSDWTDIVSVSAEEKFTIGLKADGTVVTVGFDESCSDLSDKPARRYNSEGRGFSRALREKCSLFDCVRSAV